MLLGSMWLRIKKWCCFIILERYRKVTVVMDNGRQHWSVKFEKSWGLMLNCWNQVIPKILRIYPFAWIDNIEDIPWYWGIYLPQWSYLYKYLINPKKSWIRNKDKLNILFEVLIVRNHFIWSFGYLQILQNPNIILKNNRI